MDFDHAIAAHTEWGRKLAEYLANPDRSLQPEEVSSDKRCEFGTWLAGEGRKFAKMSEYGTVVSDHARFHRVAGEIVRRANAGQKVAEEMFLGAKSEFASASSAVVRSIMALKAKVGTPVGV